MQTEGMMKDLMKAAIDITKSQNEQLQSMERDKQRLYRLIIATNIIWGVTTLFLCYIFYSVIIGG